MDSIAETINNNRSIAETIHQLHETITRQQTAINSIQATLATQQKDIAAIKTSIVDMRNSINHIIHSLSDLTTKLGVQIALPTPLPLSPTTPTLLPCTVASSPINVSSLAISTPSPFSSSPAVTHSLQSFHQTPLAHPTPTNNATFLSKTKVVTTNLTVIQLPATILDQPAAVVVRSVHATFILLGVFELKTKINESIVFIFDPGGKFDIKKLGSGGGVVSEHLPKNKLQMCMIPLQNPQAPRTICWNTRGSSQGIKMILLACCSRLHPNIHYLAKGLNAWIHLTTSVWHAAAKEQEGNGRIFNNSHIVFLP